MDGERFTSKLLEIEVINEDTKVLKFSVPENFNFNAGQHVTLAFYREDKRILRSYSIFSSPSEKGYILIYFKKVGDGFASNKLFNMKIGEEIEAKGPLGVFKVENKEKDLVFISAGTGFGPFMSMILDLLKKEFKKRIILIRGYRKESGLCFKEELDSLEMKFPNFKYYDVLSQPNSADFLLKGRVQNFLEKLIPNGFLGDLYICGLKEMVSEVREKLNEMGFLKEQIFFERYD